MCARSLTTTVLAAVAGAIRIHMPQVTLRVKITRRLSLKCWFLGHEDWIRRGPDRLYLECFDCGRETHGWTFDRTHRADRAGDGAVAQNRGPRLPALSGPLPDCPGRVRPTAWREHARPPA